MFRYSAIDKLPDPPSPAAALGTLVHRALELLYARPAAGRTHHAALSDLDRAATMLGAGQDGQALGLGGGDTDEVMAKATRLIEGCFSLEDPQTVRPIGLELRLEALIGGARVRGVIDRLELDADGQLIVTDYKTGRAPSALSEQQKLLGVNTYATLVERVCGVRPARVQLLHLAEPVAIVVEPSARSVRGLDIKVGAMWQAVERACASADFRPRVSRLCDWCSFRAYCPAQGGDPDAAWARSALNPAVGAPASA